LADAPACAYSGRGKLSTRAIVAILFAIRFNTFDPRAAQAEFVARQNSCYVNDPTEAPLNVRTSPNGHIVSMLNNGTAQKSTCSK
jgi:hypothetical protein